MIKFFRKIRQRLLTENKFSRYLLYAKGEIILVIVGILIALQVNNWNIKRVEINTLKSNPGLVVEDLNKDRNQLLELKQQRLKAIGYCTEFFESYLYSKPINYDDVVEHFRQIITDFKFEHNQNGFEKVRSTGIFESGEYQTIRDKMRAYSEVVEFIRYQENNQNQFTEDMEKELFLNGPFTRLYPYMRADFYKDKFEPPTQKLDLEEMIRNSEAMKAILIRYEYAMPWIVTFYEAQEMSSC